MTILLGTAIGLTTSRRSGGGGFSPTFAPAAMFAAGEKGAWYDPSDITTLFQDDTGTTPVTASGQTVGLMRDKSGNNLHLVQATSGARPTYINPGGGAIPSLQFTANSSFMVGASSVSYSADAAPLYVGAYVTPLGGDTPAIGFGIAAGSSNDTVSILARSSLGGSYSSRYNRGGNQISYTKSSAGGAAHYVDAQVQQIGVGGTFANSDLDLYLDYPATAGTFVANANPGAGAIDYTTRLNTANGVNATGTNTVRFHGGIVALRAVNSTDRGKLTTYFSNPR
ncbi:hypothetical protein CYK37_15225 [Mesorhizobium loti]|nr:hypothetical protein [Mesorhizobium loti]PLP58263.1 hypothetical protein CYK37_15225 [Mesorhizobium loti]